MAKKESLFKHDLYKKIRARFPGSEVLPNDAGYVQGIPDATVYLPNGRFLMLESKRHSKASHRPNQDYYVSESPLSANAMFAFPENEEEVFSELERRYNLK